MLFKINVSNVSITNTVVDNTTNTSESNTLKIESISLQEEVAPEELNGLINGITSMIKDVITTSKNKNTNTSDKRFHVVKTKDFPNGNNHILYYIWDRRTNSYYIKVGNTADIMLASYFKESINEHKRNHRIIAEYDCNNFRL